MIRVTFSEIPFGQTGDEQLCAWIQGGTGLSSTLEVGFFWDFGASAISFSRTVEGLSRLFASQRLAESGAVLIPKIEQLERGLWDAQLAYADTTYGNDVGPSVGILGDESGHTFCRVFTSDWGSGAPFEIMPCDADGDPTGEDGPVFLSAHDTIAYLKEKVSQH